jgi:DNA-binding NarL/FixJ family response regulator
VLTTLDDGEFVLRSIEAGASGHLLKHVRSDVRADAVRAVSRGDAPLQPSVRRTFLARLRSTAPTLKKQRWARICPWKV